MSDRTPAPHRRFRKRRFLPLVLLGLLVFFLTWLYVRGTWADTEARQPASAAEPPLTQLYREGDNVVVRCVAAVDAAPLAVWRVVTDYPAHPLFIPYVTALEATREGQGWVRVKGTAHSRLWGDWDFESRVLHQEDDAGEIFVARWDGGGGDLMVNRGSWRIAPFGNDQTLATYSLQIELRRVPNFLVRNILRDRLHEIVTAVREETQRRRGSAR